MRRRLARRGRGGRAPAGRDHRVHLEEDTGKSLHVGATGRIHGADYSLVDYNRAGIRWSRSCPSPTCARPRRPRVRRGAAGGAAGPRGLRRQARGRLDAVRRERVDPAGGTPATRHQGRAEEPQLAAQPVPGGRLRGRPAAAGPGRGRQARPGDAPLGRGGGADRADAVQGVRHRLPLLPRARPGPDRGTAPGSTGSGRPARAAGRAPGPAGHRDRPAAKEVGWLVRDPEVLAYFQEVASGRDPKVAASG